MIRPTTCSAPFCNVEIEVLRPDDPALDDVEGLAVCSPECWVALVAARLASARLASPQSPES